MQRNGRLDSKIKCLKLTFSRTSNWDRSLANLGFTDSDNMNRDFYAMSRQPDPLFPDMIFQQLAATSNAETTHSSGRSIIGTGMSGFEALGFGGESEGIEAGQILQALSAADGPVDGKVNR